MSAPVRVQLSRAAGWRMPDNTVKVDRSTQWGNPFVVGKTYPAVEGDLGGSLCGEAKIETAGCAVAAFRAWAEDESAPLGDLTPLRGKNLACWCAPGEPCHADVLLEIANRPVCEQVTP
ncbi:DUF4326 domain-containing protein [Hansschlegelia zhihuaiae]|uniref:DUF4326 domain-containing protein n=1 Tax=Hansschlegelia zhihuaiae TaxID=405005 RepID=A0A4Q0MF49_9HYPH|nr:DUF4326 domain-containing protein [Hansschlegelia zhihuaiae]RXF72097.1 DUF4326 domain-containing protein [Hansschlegelia zhihuaiae]